MPVKRTRRRAPWPPPRGPRPTGNEPWASLLARGDATYGAGGDAERAAVAAYRDLADVMYAARADRRLTLRGWADAAGTSLSVVSAIETGSTWPRVKTMSAAALALGLELHVEGDTDVAAAVHRRLRRRGQPRLWGGTPGSGDFIIDMAAGAGMRPATFSELRDPKRSPSMRTVLTAADAASCTVALRPREPGAKPREATD